MVDKMVYVYFVVIHLNKTLPMDLFSRALDIRNPVSVIFTDKVLWNRCMYSCLFYQYTDKSTEGGSWQ